MIEYTPTPSEEDIPIRQFVTKRLIGIDSKSSVQEAAQRMINFNIDSLVVLEDSKIVGFFTQGDLIRKVLAKGKAAKIPVNEVMETELITVDISTKLKEVVRIMAEKNIKHVLVEEKGKIGGIVTFRDLIDRERQRLETWVSRE